MKQPFTVKIIKLLAWFGLLGSLLVMSLIIYAIDGPELQNDIARGIRDGTLRFVARATGPAPDTVGRLRAYEVFGQIFPPTLLYLLVLLSISKRWTLLFRIAATISLLIGLGGIASARAAPTGANGLPFIIIGALAWLPPVTRYLKSDSTAAIG
jgi:hypothetical protein